MSRLAIIISIAVALVAQVGCSDQIPSPPSGESNGFDAGGPTEDAGTADVDEPDTGSATADTGSAPVDEIHLAASRAVTEGGFATAKACADCHSNAPNSDAMRTDDGSPVGFYDLWRASMMANAARDPLWRAMVSAEAAATPEAAEAIETKCMTCHAPMASTLAHRTGQTHSIDMLYEDDALAQLGLDGVACSTCHKIRPDNLGQDESFSGGYELEVSQTIFGPHRDPFARPMENQSGFTPVFGDHMRDSELCATCHTLHTNTLAEDGSATGSRFAEQTPYLEWLNSAYNTDGGSRAASCQSCHEPQVDIEGNPITTEIARRPNGGDFPAVQPRQPVGRHLFIGGNTLVPSILRDHADTLEPQAPAQAFDNLIASVRDQLANRTAKLAIETADQTPDGLRVQVSVENLTGHKFPTGFPSRRAWLHLRASDAAGTVVFESGGWSEKGQLVGRGAAVLDSELRDGPTQAHRQRIDKPSQVQIYQALMAGEDGEVTFQLMRAATYAKDNRLLPKGWRETGPRASDTEPAGTGGDTDFADGTDLVTYAIDTGGADGPFTIEAELVYQTLSPRFAAELFAFDTPEVRAFRHYYEQADRRPEVVDTASATVP